MWRRPPRATSCRRRSTPTTCCRTARAACWRQLVAAAADGPAGLYLQESAVQHAPLVTRPEKIIMMGFNYRRHAAETGTPIPANPTLFNKFNNALNHHGGTIALPTAAATAVRLRDRAGDRLRTRVPQRVGGRRARLRGRLLHRQRLLGARPAVPHVAVHDRQDVRRVRAARSAPGDQRPGGRSQQPAPRMPGQRRAAAGLEHERHDLQLPAVDQLRVAG